MNGKRWIHRAAAAGLCGVCLVAPLGAQTNDLSGVRDLQYGDAELRERLTRPLTLDDCIQIALQKNLPLAIARMEREVSDNTASAALGDWWPTLSLSTSRSGSRTDQPVDIEDSQTNLDAAVIQRLPLGGDIALGYSFTDATGDIEGAHTTSLSITQPLLRNFGWNRATAPVRSTQLGVASQEQALRAQILAITFQVKSAFYDVVRQRSLVQVNERAIGRDEQLVAFSQAKVDAKLATRRDVLSAEIVLEQDRSRLVLAQADLSSAIDQLANILGIEVPFELDVTEFELDLQPTPVAEASWLAKALRDNPDLQRADVALSRDELSMRVAGNARLPQLDLRLAYDDIEGNLRFDEDRSQRAHTQAWEGGVTVSYPLFNQPLRNAYDTAQLRYEQSRRLYLEVERQLTLNVREAARNLEAGERNIEVLAKTIEGAREKVEFANVNFQLGRASNLDITDAQKDLLDAETDYVDELVDYRVALARLEQLLGGTISD